MTDQTEPRQVYNAWGGRNSDGVFSRELYYILIKHFNIILYKVKSTSCCHMFTQTHSPMVSAHPISVMGSVMGQSYYCYGPNCRNGSSTYRGVNAQSLLANVRLQA